VGRLKKTRVDQEYACNVIIAAAVPEGISRPTDRSIALYGYCIVLFVNYTYDTESSSMRWSMSKAHVRVLLGALGYGCNWLGRCTFGADPLHIKELI